MSEARPITHITDYVCGSCWNSFSRGDPGVVQGDALVCPHCGHVLPNEAQDLAAVVRDAPARTDHDSESFDVASGFGADVRKTPPPRAAPTAVEAESGGFPPLDSWLPSDLAPLADEPVALVPGTTASGVALANVTPARVASGFVAGEEEFDADIAEPTPVQTDVDDLVAAAHEATPGPTAAVAADGDEDDLARQLEAAFAAAHDGPPSEAGAAVRLSQATADAPADTDEAESAAADLPLESREWKLKAMGLTYNFHGLEALLTWAGNKTKQAMSVSVNGGEDWKDFHSFYGGLSVSGSVQQAWESALTPDIAPPPQVISVTSRLPRLTTAPTKAPPPDLLVPPRPVAKSETTSAPEPPSSPSTSSAPVPAVAQPASSPSGPKPTAPVPPSPPQRQPSRPTAAQVATPPTAGPKNAKVAVAVVIALAVVAAVLKVLHVW